MLAASQVDVLVSGLLLPAFIDFSLHAIKTLGCDIKIGNSLLSIEAGLI